MSNSFFYNRKKSSTKSFPVIFSLSCTVDAINGTLVLYLVAKCAASGSFLILYPFAAEVYPTEVRGIGIGFTAYLGGLGLAGIPFINYLVNTVSTSLLSNGWPFRV